METKPRILYLQKILLERTDEENPLSTTQLINILNDEYGISAHRTTVTKDIAALLPKSKGSFQRNSIRLLQMLLLMQRTKKKQSENFMLRVSTVMWRLPVTSS